jgi:hypothetical protein
MKIILTLFLISISAFGILAQDSSVEKTFEKNKRSFSLTRFAIGEDASSGRDYLVYRQKTSTKMIRVIWSNYERATVDDYFYEAGKPTLLIQYTAKHNQYKSLARGANLPLKMVSKFYLSGSKLVNWIENGKTIPATDSRWADQEKDVIAGFDEQLDTFRMHLKGEI